MPSRTLNEGYKGDSYELLCLLAIAVCVWLVGRQLDFFEPMGRFAEKFGLTDFVVLGLCTSLALYAAALRKSKRLRLAIHARDDAKLDAEMVARHDALTGLPNRRFFHELLAARLNDRTSGAAILLIDLDRFKPINDVHGHAAGDAVLCAIASRLQSILPLQSIAARLGGDEFAVVIAGTTDPVSLTRLAREIISEISRPITWTHCQLSVGATIGVAVQSDDEDGDSLLHAADVAMYEGKKDGRGTFRLFRKEMRENLRVRALLEQELRAAIDSGQIEPFFQPLVSLVDRELIGFEVLARWRHPTRGLLGPEDFIAVAEETGMIADLCWSVLRRACLDAQIWPEHLQLAINIAPQQLHDRRLIENIQGILAETGFRPERLDVEVTETALITNIESARRALTALRKLGVRIALDDFGTGYSSLYHLRELKFDKLKIDRSYVGALSQGGERGKLVDAILSLSRSLGMATTAEGIESAGSVDWLIGKGCTYGQGYLFGRPMSNQDVGRWVLSDITAHLQRAPEIRAA